jgi:hypothetical protein
MLDDFAICGKGRSACGATVSENNTIVYFGEEGSIETVNARMGKDTSPRIRRRLTPHARSADRLSLMSACKPVSQEIGERTMSAFTYDGDCQSAASVAEQAASAAQHDTPPKTSFFIRLLEAIGRANSVEMPNGERYYFLLPEC